MRIEKFNVIRVRSRQFLVFLLFFLVAMEGSSQSKKKGQFVSADYIAKDISTFSESDLFDFPNINGPLYYYDRKTLNQISILQKRKDWDNLYPILRNYVKNFGVENFYKDTYLIWRLGKLTEIYGNKDEAILLYKIILKHHRADLDIAQIELHYDSLIAGDKDYFVPLDYYYQLVNFQSEVDTLRPPPGISTNLGKEINSKSADYGPTMNISGDSLIFSSKRNIEAGIDQVENEDLYFAIRTNGFWSKSEPLEIINSDFNEGSATLSRDGRTIYFTRCYGPDGYGDCDIYIAEMAFDGNWDVFNLGENVNSKAWDSHPSLNLSEDTLYFASDRIGSFGLSDIYYTYKDENGLWAKSKNAGPIINSRKSEISPFHHYKRNVLYFSSDGQVLNFGQFDIYKSYKIGHNWGEPKNIGPLVNGEGNEYYFTIDPESKFLYYSKSENKRDPGDLDIFSFPLPMEGQADAETVLVGSIEDNEGPFEGIVSIIDLDQGIEVAPKFLRPDGTFEFDLINNRNYLLIVRGEEFLKIEELFHLNGDTEYISNTTKITSKIEFESIVFGEGEAELTHEMFGDLDKIAEFLWDNPDFKLKISGHTDSDGREDFNLDLSQKRADTIKEYIVYFGKIEDGRIVTRGYGSSKPVVEEVSDEDKKLNRRVEFELFKESGS